MTTFRKKMEDAGVSEPAILAFERGYDLLRKNESGMMPENEIQPVQSLPSLETVSAQVSPRPELIGQTAILKLNGGLGTGMGLDRAKSLLPVRQGLTFLDLIGRQLLHFRETTGTNPRFLLMNSFSTSEDTLAWLAQHPELGKASEIELMQNKVPKIDAASLEPAAWPANPSLEWCPPGHGDLYALLAADRAIERLMAQGIRYIFVSNSDNLGATLDLTLLTWFADSGAAFMMEVTARTDSDRKGGHLAMQNGRLVLRESAQCPDEDMDAFQDIQRHRFFNTNNLWLRLDRLQEELEKSGGFLPLPVIRNKKTVDPRDKNSPVVYQLETAMGAAIQCFTTAIAVEVPRSRFAPVKTTADLLTLRSDAYVIREDGVVVLAQECHGVPPTVTLDEHYKLVDQLDAALEHGVPSLKECSKLTVAGPVTFAEDVVFQGEISVRNDLPQRQSVPSGTYHDQELVLGK